MMSDLAQVPGPDRLGAASGWGIDTRCARAGLRPFDNAGVVGPPVYHASTILFADFAAMQAATADPISGAHYYYGRAGTPTTRMVTDACSALDGAVDTVLYPSGITAIAAVFSALLKSGDKLLVTDSVYGPTRALCDGHLARIGVETIYYDPLIGAQIEALLDDRVKLLFMESPGSLTFEVQDVPAMAQAARSRGVRTAIDNSWATPLLFNPLDHGVDIHIQAATQYLAGHSDVMCGIASTRDAELARRLRALAFDFGLNLAPDDCYLLQRGLRTLPVRLRQQGETALALAHWLEAQPDVGRMLHPAFPSCAGHPQFRRDFAGSSGLFSFALTDATEHSVAAFVDALALFRLGYSWGGFESLALPVRPARYRSLPCWQEDHWIIRLQVGLEAAADLQADLTRALAAYRQHRT